MRQYIFCKNQIDEGLTSIHMDTEYPSYRCSISNMDVDV